MTPQDASLLDALDARGLRLVLVDNLGRDALVFTQYRLALVDTVAARERSGPIAEFIAAG